MSFYSYVQNQKLLVRLALIAATSLVPGAIYAQIFLEEVIVTAQKREQNLQDVGVSVTALSGEQMRALGMVDATDIEKAVPGVLFANTSSGHLLGTLSVRGVAQSDFSPNQESPNAIYVDEVYISTPLAASFALYDLDRVEVLRGPQGTLYGRNSTGGLAHFITAKPSDSFEAYAQAGYGEFDQFYGEAAVSGPLSGNIRARLSGRYENSDGWWENKAPGGRDFFENEAVGVRGQVEVDISNELMARLSVSYDKRPRTLAGTYKIENYFIDADGQPAPQPADLDVNFTGPGNNFIGFRDPFGPGPVNADENVGFHETERVSPTLRLEWQRGSTVITSVTNYTDFTEDYNEACDGSPIDYCQADMSQNMEQWSQEVRATGVTDRFTWTAGAYYLDIENRDNRLGFLFPLLAGSDFAFEDFNVYSQETISYAFFAQLEWALTDAVQITAGGRYTHDKKTFDSKVFFTELGNGYAGGTGSTVFMPPLLVYDFSTAAVGDDAVQKEDLWSGKIQADYRTANDNLLYASISRGVKGAGFNTNIGSALTVPETPFDSESVLAYELGGKFELLDGSLRINGSAFYYDYENYQGFAFNGLQGVVGNYDGTFHGGEVEVVASLPNAIQARFGASYTDSELEDIPTAYSGVRDQESILAPKWILNGMIYKSMDIGPGTLGLQWSFNYRDDRYSSVDNNRAVFVDDAFIHDARLTYMLDAAGIELAAFVNNISDVNNETFAYDLIATGGYRMLSYAEPRWWGVSIRKNF